MAKKNQPVLKLSAEKLSCEEQFEAMRTCATPITDLRLSKVDDVQRFRAESTWYLLDNIIMSQVSSSALHYHRDKKKIAQNDDLDYYIFHLSLKGSYLGVSGDNLLQSDAGSITVMDLREEIYGRSSDSELLSVVIPRHLLENADQLHSMTMAQNHVKTRILREHILSLWHALPDIEVAENPAFSQGLVALTNALFSSGKLTTEHNPILDVSKLTSMKSFIEKNLRATNLGVTSICQEFSCSRAALYRLFQPLGGVSHYIKERRLVEIFKVLVRPSANHKKIFEVAMRYGFDNQSNFSRMFRQYFSVTPKEVMALKSNQVKPDILSTQSIVTAEHIARWLKIL